MWNHMDHSKFQAVGSDSSIAKLLRSQPDINENVIRKMCNDVTYADLSALKQDDLELFGVEDKDKQSQLVSEFSALTNQEQSLQRFLIGLRADDYQERVYSQVHNQLNAIAFILEAVEQHTGSDWNNILVKSNTYISMVLLRALAQVSGNSFAMRIKNKTNQFKWICGGALVAALLAVRKMM